VPCGKMQLPSAAERIAALAEFIRSFAAATELLLVGSSREAVDDLVQGLAHTSGATFGLHRFSFTRLAARLASRRLGGGGSHAQLRSRCGLAARAAYEAAVRNKLRRQLRRKETLTMKSSSSRLARVPFPLK